MPDGSKGCAMRRMSMPDLGQCPKLDINAPLDTIRRRSKRPRRMYMGSETKVTENVVSCSDNGQHPLVYINLKDGKGHCQYCGQVFVRTDPKDSKAEKEAA